MKLATMILAALATSALLVAAAPAIANDAHHPQSPSVPQGAAAQPEAKSAKQTVTAMQANVKKMQVQLERIAQAKTDSERQQAMAEHMLTMQENMRMARGMQASMTGCPMMGMMGRQPGSGMMMEGMMDQGASGTADPMSRRMDMMEKRMDMMQMMMQDRMGMPAGGVSQPAK